LEVKLVRFPETKVAVIEHRGSPALEHESTKKLIAWRIENKLLPNKHKNYGVHYDDPNTTPPESYRVDLCISFDKKISENSFGIINKIIPTARCAMVRHVGPRNMMTAARYLYKTWFPTSGEKLGEFPIFFHYVNTGPDIQEADMITDVYLPLV